MRILKIQRFPHIIRKQMMSHLTSRCLYREISLKIIKMKRKKQPTNNNHSEQLNDSNLVDQEEPLILLAEDDRSKNMPQNAAKQSQRVNAAHKGYQLEISGGPAAFNQNMPSTMFTEHHTESFLSSTDGAMIEQQQMQILAAQKQQYQIIQE